MSPLPVEKLGKHTSLISSGSTPLGGSQVYLTNGPVLFIRSQNVLMNQLDVENAVYISDEMDRKIGRTRLRAGDVLLNITGASIGRVATFDGQSERANVNQHVCVIRPDAHVLNARYLSCFIATPEFQRSIQQAQVGGTRQALTFSQIADFEVPFPPIAEQRRIAEVLDRAEALRAKRRAALAQLDALTQSIFLDLFGDPTSNPKGWPIRPVSDYVAEFQGGRSIEAESGEHAITVNRVLKISAVTGMRFLPHESKPVPDSYDPPHEHFTKTGDLLFSRANTTELVGAVAYVETTPPNLLLPDKLWRFVWRLPLAVTPLFVWALFQTPTVRREIARRATGTSGSMKNISQAKVFGIKTILPPFSLQREFACRIAAVEQMKATQRAALAELDALFAVLQHRAFRGEL
jgi:type I restriction enzyme S subunit